MPEPKAPPLNHVVAIEDRKENSLEISERIKFDWLDVEKDCTDLAEKIKSPNVVIISIGTGGWIPSKLLKSLLTKNNQTVELSTIVAGYTDLHTPSEEVQLLQNLSQETITRIQNLISENGYELVIFDTLINTGRSIQCALDYFKSIGFDNIKIATLHWEEQPRINVPSWRKFSDIKPDYFTKKIVTHSVNPYIEYPWDNLDN